jgi:putative tryptophan/tyrosine transport system substrate-binding protein
MKRRKFITLLGGGAAAVASSVSWPLVAQEQPGRMRRIGMLWIIAETDPQATKNREAFLKQLHQMGWRAGDNVHLDHRSAADDANRQRAYAAELIGLAPDLIVAEGTPGLAAAQLATRTVPIIFVNVTDPVGQGFVENLARPGGNATGFTLFEFSMGTKWLEILRELVPSVKKVGFMFNPAMAPYSGLYLRSIQQGALSFGIEPYSMPVDDESGVERSLSTLGQQPDSGLIVLQDAFTVHRRNLIIDQVARYRIPAVYTVRLYPESGGLVSYGVDFANQYRQAAIYADRILKGAKPGELPVQQPTKFELMLNLKTARALGLQFPPKLLAIADEVIE